MAEEANRGMKRQRFTEETYPSSSSSSVFPNDIRRGTKVSDGSRPGTVVIVAKATNSSADGGYGTLEVPESEYLAFKEAERIKCSTDGSHSAEQKAVASVTSRKFLNKWRERWAYKPASEGQDRNSPSSSRKRKADHDHASPSTTNDLVHAGEIAQRRDHPTSRVERTEVSVDFSPEDLGSSVPSPPSPIQAVQTETQDVQSPFNQEQHLPNIYVQTQAMILQKILTLEASQNLLHQRLGHLELEIKERLGNLEANMAVMQANQGSIESGVARILEALQRR
ncbi:hypothetical protein FRB99_005741 [Tulasnella sp. 403]|nr:hypothetical protein FRB99_005741 [Tulasnella sp. 403]